MWNIWVFPWEPPRKFCALQNAIVVDPELTLAVSVISICNHRDQWDGICTKTVVWIITFTYWPTKKYQLTSVFMLAKVHTWINLVKTVAQDGNKNSFHSTSLVAYMHVGICAWGVILNVHSKWSRTSFTTDEIILSSHLSPSFIHFGTNVLLQSHLFCNQLHGKNILAYRDLHTLLSNKPPGVFCSVYT